MQKKEKENDQLANSNPTARNFQRPNDEEKEQRSPSAQDQNGAGEEEEEDDDVPELDEQDLEENDLTDEEADNIEWDPESDKGKKDQRR
ncbi:MAG TPA: hypothetical protein VGE90_18790 [Chitinophaga sp.]